MKAYILVTKSGARHTSYDSLVRAREARERAEARLGIKLDIIEQTIVERKIV